MFLTLINMRVDSYSCFMRMLQQSKTMTNTVHNILQNDLKGMRKKYAESTTWQTQSQNIIIYIII